ncbi:MAG: hypothetical protein ABIP93_00025 [Gemmatimonadaceae bacterium]
MLKASSLVLIASLAMVSTARAQAVPNWTLDIVGGSGLRTERANDAWYQGDRSTVARFAFGKRLGAASRMAAYLSAEVSPDLDGDYVSICVPAPDGSCRRHFERSSGVGAGIGTRVALTRRALLGAQVGGGRYGGHARGFVEGTGAIRILSHLGVVAGARYVIWSVAGARHWYAPVTVGLQILD